MQTYANGTLAEILRTHGINMSNANRCRARHAAIVQAIENLREANQ